MTDWKTKIRNAVNRFMKIRIGGRLPVWWIVAAALVLALLALLTIDADQTENTKAAANTPKTKQTEPSKSGNDDFFEKYEQYDFEKNVEQFPLFDKEFDIYEIPE